MRYAEARQVEAALGGRYHGQSFSGITGTMAAALAANATVAAVRYPLAATRKFLLTWLHLHVTCLGAFTIPVTAGRRLALKRGSGGDPSGGTDLDVGRDDSAEESETLVTGQIATTGALTMTGVTYETPTRRRLPLSHVGSAGLDYDELWTWKDGLLLRPGQLAGIVAPAQFDAAGTWELNFSGGGYEV